MAENRKIDVTEQLYGFFDGVFAIEARIENKPRDYAKEMRVLAKYGPNGECLPHGLEWDED